MEDTLFIGIDFGATHSSVSFCFANNRPISNVRFKHGATRAPTAITYGDAKTKTWGHGTDSNGQLLTWFKFSLLHPDDFLCELRALADVEHALHTQALLQLDSSHVVGDYLYCLMAYALESMGLKDLSLWQPRTHIVLTAPGTFRDYYHALLKDAVCHAGVFGLNNLAPLTFLSEQEAAALALIWLDQLAGPPRPGDQIVVCDCGGGTVDIGAYQVASNFPPSMLECAPSRTSPCGAAFVDDKFRHLLLGKLRGLLECAGLVSLPHLVIKQLMLQYWEKEIKYKFTEVSRTSFLEIPLRELGIASAHPVLVEFNNDELRAIFDPAVDKICDLIQSQIKSVFWKTGRHPDYLLVCGGFGTNQYLRSRIDALDLGPTRLLPCPTDTDFFLTAVSRGAALRAIQSNGPDATIPHVDSHVCPASFGIANPGNKHSITWIAHKDDDIPTSHPHRLTVSPGQFQQRLTPGGLVSWLEIVKSLDRQPQITNTFLLCRIEFVGTNPVAYSPIDIELKMAGGIAEFLVYRGGTLQNSQLGQVNFVYQNWEETKGLSADPVNLGA